MTVAQISLEQQKYACLLQESTGMLAIKNKSGYTAKLYRIFAAWHLNQMF
ncbi:MAG: hypothetical protein WA071_20155 [Undibacterium umbellatum]|nr:hypothetical protein [Undibacterium pigrum]